MDRMEPDELDDPNHLTRSNLAGANAKQYRKSHDGRPSMVMRSPDVASEVSAGTNMTPKMEVLLRKEQKLHLEESQYTFKPNLATSGRKQSRRDNMNGNMDGVNRFDRLYSDALKRHLETKWKESNDSADLTFTPKISAKVARSMSRPGSRAQSRERGTLGSSPNNATFNRLYEAPTGRVRNPVDEPTFQPSISRRARSIDPKESAKRLYAPDYEKERREKIRQDIEDKEFESFTFSPELNNKTTKILARKGSKNVMERMEKYENLKQHRLLTLQREKEQQEMDGVTFKPELVTKHKRSSTPNSATRRSMQRPKPTDEPFHERLAKPSEKANSELIAESHAEMTFQPKLATSRRNQSPNPMRKSNSFRNPDNSPNEGIPPEEQGEQKYSSVHERLFIEGQRRLKNTELQRKMTKEEMDSSFTFTPEINRRSKVVAGNSNDEPVFDRLATSSSRIYMQEVLQKVKADLELRDCTFQPQLISKRDNKDRSKPVYDRLNEEGKRIKEQHRRASVLAQEQEVTAHSFAPKIPEASQNMAQDRTSGAASTATSVHGSSSVTSSNVNDVHSRLYGEKLHQSTEFRPENVELKKSLVRSEKENQAAAERLSKKKTRNLSILAVEDSGKWERGEDPKSPVNSPHMRAHSPKPRLPRKDIDSVVNRLTVPNDGSAKPRARSANPIRPTASKDSGDSNSKKKKVITKKTSSNTKPADQPEKLIPPSTLHHVYDKQNSKKNSSNGESTLGNFDFIDNPSHGNTPAGSRQSSFRTTPGVIATAMADVLPPKSTGSNVNDHESTNIQSEGAPSKPLSSNNVAADINDEVLLPSAPNKYDSVIPPAPPSEDAEVLNHVPTSSSYHTTPSDSQKCGPEKENKKTTRKPQPARIARTSSAFVTKASDHSMTDESEAGSVSDEFLAKIEQSMMMLKMDPASVVAAQKEAEAEEAEAAAAAMSNGTN